MFPFFWGGTQPPIIAVSTSVHGVPEKSSRGCDAQTHQEARSPRWRSIRRGYEERPRNGGHLGDLWPSNRRETMGKSEQAQNIVWKLCREWDVVRKCENSDFLEQSCHFVLNRVQEKEGRSIKAFKNKSVLCMSSWKLWEVVQVLCLSGIGYPQFFRLIVTFPYFAHNNNDHHRGEFHSVRSTPKVIMTLELLIIAQKKRRQKV